ncbi:hypothetical protein KKE14_02970 [Patescibacteria group bacterium]|nr:hypothetical protein [Patescibacteria group bacterium]
MFHRAFHHDFTYSAALNVNSGGKSFEVDFVIVKQKSMSGGIEIGVGEAKDTGGEIEQADIDNLLRFVDAVTDKDIKCYPIFSKTADRFQASELERFGELADKGIPFIVINNPQLDHYFPNWATWTSNTRYKYASSLEEMAHNTIYRYSKMRWVVRLASILKYSKIARQMKLTDKQIKEYQTIFEKEYGEKIPREEAEESARNLINFMELMLKLAHKEHLRKQRLEKEPEGFHIEGQGYNCMICSNTISDQETWYDKYGIKCLICQEAVKKKKIPVSALKNRDSWYSDNELKWKLDIKRSTINRLIREGELKPRLILNSNGKTHCQLFLLKENPSLVAKKPAPQA